MRQENEYFKKILRIVPTTGDCIANGKIRDVMVNILVHDTDDRNLKFVNDVLNKYGTTVKDFCYYDHYSGIEYEQDVLVIKEIPENVLNILNSMESKLQKNKKSSNGQYSYKIF